MPLWRLRPTLLDRYLIREILPPTGLGLLMFTFVLLLQQVTLLLGVLISRGADLPTVIRVFVYLLPSILAVTIPMAFLLGVLLALGRLATDSEIVALRASGISPAWLLRPVLVLALLTGSATFYVMAVALPAANQAHRQIVFSLVVNKARTSIKPRVFTDDLLPGTLMLYVSDVESETGEWRNVFMHDRRDPQKPRVILARRGHLVIDEARKAVEMHLETGTIHASDRSRPEVHDEQRFTTADLPLPFEQFFPQLTLPKGDREMTLGELSERYYALRAQGKTKVEIARYAVEWHKKFSIPVACFVFGLLGLGLSLGSKKEARQAAFALSIAVIFIYYVIIRLGEQAGDTGLLAPWLAMWGANIVLGAAAIVLLVLNQREAAFDPLDPSHYTAWLPRIRRASAATVAARPRPSPRPVVVVRVPRIHVRFPGILDRYIGRAFVSHFTLVLVAFWAFFMLGEFLDLFDDVQTHKIKGRLVLHYFAFHSPFIVHLIAPFAVLVATLTTFGILSRRNEITAMKAGGISIYRSTAAAIVLGLLCSMGMMAMGEFLLPHTNRVAGEDRNVIRGRPPQSSTLNDNRWVMGRDDRLYNFEHMAESRSPGAFGRRRSEPFALYGLSVYDVDPRTWQLRGQLYASEATWNGASYDLTRGWRRGFTNPAGYTSFNSLRNREIEPPNYFNREERESDSLGFIDLRRHISSLQAKGFDVVRLRVQLHQKLAFPFIGVVMTLLGIPFSFVVGRRGALYGIGISIVLAMLLWAFLAVFKTLGENALLPPLLAAWAPNLLFGAAGLYMMLTLES
jgi:LPS export ABC transporter permease LptF/LPS export ABC transporter permease LptG